MVPYPQPTPAAGCQRQGALLRSVASGICVYDTLFVELAARFECPLVTFDKAMLKTFPDIAVRPRDLPEA
jgi:predicted nucleic acid-binding protein